MHIHAWIITGGFVYTEMLKLPLSSLGECGEQQQCLLDL